MSNCKISLWNNTWTDQFDFTVNKNKCNFTLMDDEADNFIESFSTITKNIMKVKAKELSSMIDVSDVNIQLEEDNMLPVIPITTGSLNKPANYNVFLLFLASDSNIVHAIYHYFYQNYLKGKRNERWLKCNK